MMQEYLCSACHHKFSDESYNYLYFAGGGLVKCDNCEAKLVPAYNFYLMRSLVRLMIMIAVTGLLFFSGSVVLFGFDSVGKWVLLATSILFSMVGIWHRFLEVGTGARLIATREKKIQ